MLIEKQTAYRAPLEDQPTIRAELKSQTAQVEGTVLDLNLKGVSIRVDLDQNPAFAIGEELTVLLHSGAMGAVQAQALVESRAELEGARRFGLAFPSIAALRAKMSFALFRLFNERKTFRVEPSDKAPIRVYVFAEGFQKVGQLRDICADGLGIVLEGECDTVLSQVVEIKVTFQLPGHDSHLSFKASIRNRHRLASGAVSYGVAFDSARSQDFVAQQEKVTAYVMERTRLLNLARREA